ncbi:MAG: hypothetical protein PF572_05975 [Patescibacteria group bacterium]|jgi:ActR/RegA family two-component response regulator|nr:hypothetical protein [Patescibacteria group bacterium]
MYIITLIEGSDLLEDDKILLDRLKYSFENNETPPEISRESYEEFIAKFQKLTFDNRKIELRLIQTDKLKISINWANSAEMVIPLDQRKKKNFVSKGLKSRKRARSNSAR